MNGTMLGLIAGASVFIVVVAVVVVVGPNRHNVVPGKAIAVAQPVAPTPTYQTPDNTGQPPDTTTTTEPTATEPTTTEPSTTEPSTTEPSTSFTQGEVPDGYMAETGPAGIQVTIPSGWTVTHAFASEDEADDPAGSGSLIRYGGTPSPAASLLDSVTSDETSNTSVKTGYQQIQLDEVDSLTGDDTVVWEFMFNKSGVQRHVVSWFWRAHGYDYVVYASSTEANWAAMQPTVNVLEQTAGPA